MRRLIAVTALALAAFSPPALAAAPVEQLVVFRDGSARQSAPALASATAKVGRRRCTVGAGTPLAALIRSGVGPLSLRDYGSCSKHAADASGLFVAAIGADRNKGSDGWVYKAGNVLGTAGAGDPSGPLGHGRLKPGVHVTWFWCHVSARDRGCPHTLGLAITRSGNAIAVSVRQYDDRGKGKLDPGATVHAGAESALTDAKGVARFSPAAGSHRVWAEQNGRIRSFTKQVRVG